MQIKHVTMIRNNVTSTSLKSTAMLVNGSHVCFCLKLKSRAGQILISTPYQTILYTTEVLTRYNEGKAPDMTLIRSLSFHLIIKHNAILSSMSVNLDEHQLATE